MMKFMFLLTVFSQHAEPQVQVQDYALTGDACIARMVAYARQHPTFAQGMPSCKFNQGQGADRK
jgi:hypothetical protein